MKTSIGQERLRETLQPVLFRLLHGLLVLLFSCCLIPLHASGQSFRSAASAGAGSGVTTLTINKPAGTVAGDVMIAVIAVRRNNPSVSPPTGWTSIRRTYQNSGNRNAQELFWKTAGASEPSSYSFTLSASDASAGAILSFYGVDPFAPEDVSGGQVNASSLNQVAPSISTSVPNTIIVSAHSFASCATWTPPTGMTEAIEATSAAVPTDGISMEINYVAQAGTGATGTKTAVASSGADVGVGQTLALKPCTASMSYAGSPYCTNGGTASVTFSGSSGGTFSSTPGLSINSSTGAVTLGSSTPGTYTVSYDAAGVCSTTASITVTKLPVATFSYTGTPYCSHLSNPFPTFSGGGVAGTFSSTAGLVFVSTATGEVDLAASTPGTYTVTNTIAASNGCAQVSANASITITQAPYAIGSYPGSPYCENAGFIAPQGTTSGGGVFSATPGLALNTSSGVLDINSSTTGFHTVFYTIPPSGGCTTFVISQNIEIVPIPGATISYTGTPYCTNGGTATVSRSGTAGGTYSSTAGLSIDATTGAVNLAASTPGTYTVTYTIAAYGCPQFSTNTSITVTGAPSATISYAGTPYCSNGGTASVSHTGTTGGTYTSSAGLSINASTGAVNLAASTAGSYTVTYTIAAANGCALFSTTAGITITTAPSATISYTGSPYCANAGTASVNRTGTAGGTYSSSAGLSLNGSTGAVNLASSTPGSYTVTYTIAAAGGCALFSTTANITVTAVPSATISYTGSPYCSNGGTASVTQTGTAGGTYSSTPGLSINSVTGAVNLAASTAGSYTITYTIAAAGGCALFSTTAGITITAAAAATISYNGSPYCSNSGTASVTHSGTAGGTYSSTAGLALNASTGAVNLASSTPGSYTVTYTIPGANGCALFSTTAGITVTLVPSAAINYSGSPYLTSAGTATVNHTGTTGGTYSSTPGLSINSSTGDITLVTSTPGTYTVTYSIAAGGGCSLFTTAANVTVTDNVLVTASGGTASASYSRLGLATAAINAGTHTGAITITVYGNTTETGPCVLNSSGAGSASYSSILLQPGTDGVTVAGPTTTGRGLLELNGADNVTIDGDNPSTPGTNRNLSFQNTAATSVNSASVIRIALSTLITTANNNTVRNCNIIGNAVSVSSQASTSQSAYTSFGIVASGGASTAAATTAPSALAISTTITSSATVANFTVTNNSIYSVGRGVMVTGTAATVATGLLINNNEIGQSTATNSIYAFGITVQGSSNGVISGNTILNVQSSAPSLIVGIDAGTVSNVAADFLTIENNTISHVFNTNIGCYGAAGINIAGGTGHLIQNNFVINVKNDQTFSAGSFSTTFGAFGIRIANRTNHKVYHNSVHLYGAHTGSNMTDLTAAFAITASNITGVDVRNNIFSNVLSGGSSSGTRHAVIYLPASATSSMNLTINNNLYYQGSNSLNILGQVGTNPGTGEYLNTDFDAASTSPALNFRSYTSSLSAAGTNDNASMAIVSFPLPFISHTDLHISAGSNAPLESLGASIGSVTTDIDGDTRPGPAGSVHGGGSAPDIGGDEYDGLAFVAPPSISYTELGSCVATNRTFTVTITNPTGIPTAGANVPRVWYKKNAGAWFSQQGVLTSGSGTNGTWSFTIVAADMGGLILGDVVSYYVAAQNTAGFVSTNPAVTFLSDLPPNVNTVALSPVPYTYNVANTAGTFTVGVGQHYTTITEAIADYNNNTCMSGPIVLSLTDASYPNEMFPLTIRNNAQASAVNTLTIQPAAGVAVTVSATTAISIFKLLNARYVTIDGVNASGSSLTITNSHNTTDRAAIWLASTAGTGPGCDHVTIRNLTINAPSNSASRYGIIAAVDGSGITTIAGADNDNITIENNTFIKAYQAIYASGTAAASSGGLDNWVISGNTFGPGSYSATDNIGLNGLYLNGMVNLNVSGNTIRNVGLTNSTAPALGAINMIGIDGALVYDNTIMDITSNSSSYNTGIELGSGVVNTKLSANTITHITNVNTSGYGAKGIVVNTGMANSNDTIVNNMLADIYSYSEVSSARWPVGIELAGTSGAIKVWHNSVNLFGSQPGTSTASGSAAMLVNTSGGSLDIRNNVFVNTYDNSTSSNNKGWAIYSSQSGTAQYLFIDNNDYYTSSPNVPGYITSDRPTVSDIQAGFGGNTASISYNPNFVSSTDLHISGTTSGLESIGASLGINTDIDGDARPGPIGSVNGGGTAPDLGADEFDAAPQDLYAPAITYTPLGDNCGVGNRTLTAMISDAAGVASGADLPRIYYKRVTDPSWFSQPGSLTSGTVYNGTYTFTIISANMTNLIAGDIVEYFIAAEDLFGNVGSYPAAGFTATSVNNISTYPATPDTYTINIVAAAITAQTNILCNGTATGSATVTASGSVAPYTYAWAPSGGTAATASALAAGTYTVTVTDALGCSATTTAVITQAPVAGTWTGATSSDWHIAGNWLCNAVPVGIDVIIPTGLSTYPVISSGIASVDELTLGTGASIKLNNTLEIAGTITNSGAIDGTTGTVEMTGSAPQTIPSGLFTSNELMNLTLNNAAGVALGGPLNLSGVLLLSQGDLNSSGNLTLLSKASGNALIDGSGTGDVIGNVTMQRYLPSGFGYKYFSSPFQSSTVSEFANDLNLAASFPTFYRYDENLLSNGWVNYTNPAGTLNPLEGYAANFGPLSPPRTVDITGVVTNGSVGPGTLFNNDRPFTQGFNLIGNPYPSPIDWDAPVGWTRTNIDDAVYYFDAGTTDQYTGTYSSYINGVSSNGQATNIIPAMQGFFVHVSNGSFPVTGSLSLDNDVRVNDLTPVFHKTTKDDYPLFRLGVSYDKDDTTSDNVVVYFEPDATMAFDPKLDALKLDNTNTAMPGLYARSQDDMRLSIAAVPAAGDTDRIVPLGLKLQRSGNVHFSAKTIESVPSDIHIHLLDMFTQATHDLTWNPEYSLSLSSGTYEDRFYLVFSRRQQVDDLLSGPLLNATLSNGKLFVDINLRTGDGGELVARNTLGQVVLKNRLNGFGRHEINFPFASGMYIISYSGRSGVYTRKVLK